MSIIVNLFDCVLAKARKSQEQGRTLDAQHLLSRMANFRELPAEVAEEVQVRLGEICLKRRKYNRARRHLTAALRHRPDEARYHHLMGLACLHGGQGDLKRADEHFRRSLELDATQVKCLVDAGLLAIRLGRAEQGVDWLREAAERAPQDPVVTGKLARGLRQTGQSDEARRVLRAALFRNPRDIRFRRLWQDFRFQQLRQEQERQRLDREELAEAAEGPVLLPFVRPAPQKLGEAGSPKTRQDAPAPVPGPHLHLILRRSDQRHVQ